MTNKERELCGYESIILCVSTCVLCGGGFHQQSLIVQRLQQWKYSRILTQKFREVWVLAMVFPAPQGATEAQLLGSLPFGRNGHLPGKALVQP